ncbi:uncharacterized protein LOC129255387 [Lytechinus pictus]|uniref:uncharacterized protein LOC129255387 n=1 Tax=Lytechinus pictus TaxID=7653 RepID=UPI0030BA1632
MVKDTVQELIQNDDLPKNASNLIQDNPRCSTFYLLPKIHKANTPGRPIVSTCNCPTELVSQYLDSILAPLVTQLPTYVKDSSDAVRLIRDVTLDERSKHLLFTMDISSLYTNIPIDDGLRALRYFLERNAPDDSPSVETLLRLAELVLRLSAFEFDGRYYKQHKGVAMGTKMDPSYACLFVGLIDDYLGISTGSEEDLQDFIAYANNYHPSLKFTHCISSTSVDFLDISISIEDLGLSTDVFYKPTSSHSYLKYDSSHPAACKKAIPYSHMTRLRRICSDDARFKQRAAEMGDFFVKRGYPQELIQHSIQRSSVISQDEALTGKINNNKSRRVPLVMTYHSTSALITRSIKNNAKLFLSSPSCKEIFGDNPVLLAYRKDRSLRDHLVRSKLPPNQPADAPGTSQCGRPRCNTCPYVMRGDVIQGPRRTWRVKASFKCTTRNVVYAIRCSRCSKLYIGETKRRLADRVTEHLRSIRLNTPGLPVATHFNQPGHFINDLQVCVAIPCDRETDRKLKEEKLIYSLGTLAPHGMNVSFRAFPMPETK